MTINEIGVIFVFYFLITSIPISKIINVCKNKDMGISFLNPIANYYKNWTNMNWFGVIFWTIIVNIVLCPYAVCYWFYKLCTFGRKRK